MFLMKSSVSKKKEPVVTGGLGSGSKKREQVVTGGLGSGSKKRAGGDRWPGVRQ